MATKKSSKSSRKKKAVPAAKFTILAPCCSTAIDLALRGTDFSAEIDGSKFQHVRKISLTSTDPMTVFGLSRKGVFTDFDPWRVYIVKGRPGQTLMAKDRGIGVKSKVGGQKKAKPRKKPSR